MIVEMVELKVRAEVSEEEFLRAAEAASAFLRTLPGFLRRRLLKGPDEEWVDYVEWASMPEALAAAAAFNGEAATDAFNAALAPGSVRMRHFSIAAEAD
jgi:heme-degrading monooxygenase HmoA